MIKLKLLQIKGTVTLNVIVEKGKKKLSLGYIKIGGK
jgi:hypothetical protein